MDRIALVTGGAGGLGFSAAHHLAADGVKVVLTDLDIGAASAAVARLPAAGHIGMALDVANEAAVIAAFAKIEGSLGPIAVLAHFAGTQGGPGPSHGVYIADMSADSWRTVFEVNTFGTFLCVREMIRHRRRLPATDSRIITVSSLAGQMGGYLAGAGYAASKAAVIVFTKNAAREVAPLGITVNTIAPGAIETPMYRQAAGLAATDVVPAANVKNIPMGRIGLPDEVGALACFLASPAASYITGQVIAANGGSYM